MPECRPQSGTPGIHVLIGAASFDGASAATLGDYLVIFDCPVATGQVAAPQVLPPTGTVVPVQPIIITSTTPDAAFHYTTDGSVPDADDLLWDPANLPGFATETTLRLRAFKDGLQPSEVVTVFYPASAQPFPALITKVVSGDTCSPVVKLTIANGTVTR